MGATMQKTAKTAAEYISVMKERGELPRSKRVASLNAIKASAATGTDGFMKAAQGYIGPVMMRLKYEGIVRNVLTEDPIAPGDVPIYDVADEMGKAYMIDPYSAEAEISQYEGKRIQYGFKHVTAFPTVQEQDLLELTINMMDYAMNEARQRIQEIEDNYLFAMLDAAVDNFTVSNPDFAGITSHVLSLNHATYAYTDFIDAKRIADQNRLEAKNIILNNADYNDLLTWDIVATGVKYKDSTFDGTPVTSFAGFNVFKSVLCPKGKAYVMPDSDFVGRMPVRKSLEVRENPKLETFSMGSILDEYINELILNGNGIVRIVKSA